LGYRRCFLDVSRDAIVVPASNSPTPLISRALVDRPIRVPVSGADADSGKWTLAFVAKILRVFGRVCCVPAVFHDFDAASPFTEA